MRKHCVILIFIYLLPVLVFAQGTLPMVQAELIVFKHLAATEMSKKNLLEIMRYSTNEMSAAYSLFDASTAVSTIQPIQLSNNYSLEEQYIQLLNSDKFEVLHRVAWQQPQYDVSESFFISIVPEFRRSLLKGNVRLSYDNLYQLQVELLYDLEIDEEQPQEKTTRESNPVFIKMSKVMTDEKIYYLDHALIGILAVIHEIETPSL